MSSGTEDMEKSLKNLQSRVSALESSAESNNAGSSDLVQFQKTMVKKLEVIKAQLEKDNANRVEMASSSDMDALKAENAALAKENTALNYRIRHLVKELEKCT